MHGPQLSLTLQQYMLQPTSKFSIQYGTSQRWEGMGRGAQRPGEDTGYQHLALDGCMAGWHRVGPLRGLLLNPVTIRGESRRTRRVEAEEHGSKDRGATAWWKLGCMPPNGACRGTRHHKDLSAPRYPAGACASAAPD